MATRLKPTRINVDNTPRVWDGATYQDDNKFKWSEWGGDMSYEDFEWVTLTWNSLVIEKISNNVTPTGNFTVSAGTLRPGIEYVLRVNTGNTPYTMTLWTGVTNPNGYSTELTPNKVNQFKFIATSDSQLELEGVDTSDFVTLGTQQTITAKKTFNVEPELGTAKTTDATNNGTKLATEAQVYKKIDKVQSPTADHLASLTSGGEVADSGIAKSTVELNTNKETGDAPTDTTSKYPSSHTVKKYVDDQVSAATAGAVSNDAYDPTTWDGVTWIAPSKNAVRDKIVTMDSAISGNTSNISTINGKIPNEASTSNQLADKAYVGDSINSVTAFYITKNAAGDQFATYAELVAATTFYSWGQVRVPTRNDYTIVLDDENHDHATTRYIYNSVWEYQYTVNETPLTQAQLNALNSGITAAKVTQYDWYATGKQDALTTQTAYTNKWTSTKVPQISTNNLGQVTSITEQNIAFPVTDVNGQTGSVTLNDVKISASAPSNPTAGTVWYDTTEWKLKVRDGSAWQGVGSSNITTINVTLPTSWRSANSQTVSAQWVESSNTVIVSPIPDDISEYIEHGVYCYNQGSWTLTFKCDTTPTYNITVNVVIIN